MEEGQLKQYDVDIISFTDPGTRLVNEDRVFYKEIDSLGHLFLITDGMGGYDHGDIAAEIATKAISETILNNKTLSVIEAIENSFFKAHNAINNALENAGATAGGILITNKDIFVFWAGDVKILMRNGKQAFISKEHNLLNLLKDSNLTIKAEDVNRLTNTVVRSLGGKSNSYSPQIVQLQKKGKVSGIICSDGFSKLHNSEDLIKMLSNDSDNTNIVESLFNAELYKDADDNVSAIFFFSR